MDCLVKLLGGYTAEEYGTAVAKIREDERVFYLEARLLDLNTDLADAEKAHRPCKDIQRRLEIVASGLVNRED